MKNYLFSTEDYYDENDENIEDLCYEDEKNFLKYMQEINNNCLAIGKVQRWNGIFSGILYGDFLTLYNKILKDCDTREVYIENDILHIYGIHHDGWVSAEIYFLTDEGEEIIEEQSNEMNQKKIYQFIIDNKYYININNLIKDF